MVMVARNTIIMKLGELVKTAGFDIVESLDIKIVTPNPSFYIGKGRWMK